MRQRRNPTASGTPEEDLLQRLANPWTIESVSAHRALRGVPRRGLWSEGEIASSGTGRERGQGRERSERKPPAIPKSPLPRALTCREVFFGLAGSGDPSGGALAMNILSMLSMYHSTALATASAHDMIFAPFPAHAGRWHDFPFSCWTIMSGLTPDRRAGEASLPIASDCEAAHPPAFPIWLNTSKIPFSSRFMVT